MKIVIRSSVFETNSSSTHSLSLMLMKDYELWQSSNIYFLDPKTNDVITHDEVATRIITLLGNDDYNNELEYYYDGDEFQFFIDHGYRTYNQFLKDIDEREEKILTLPDGSQVIAISCEIQC